MGVSSKQMYTAFLVNNLRRSKGCDVKELMREAVDPLLQLLSFLITQ